MYQCIYMFNIKLRCKFLLALVYRPCGTGGDGFVLVGPHLFYAMHARLLRCLVHFVLLYITLLYVLKKGSADLSRTNYIVIFRETHDTFLHSKTD